ncbi:MAG: hypothetical protein COV67_08190 [Nitrospinae bacterium CG11_big_fil_rev_8_21_14_0_20_56_8]|nr:MAG: hypothetical protein COV67_08190 [Nitrospinae bacterium CG11_big_fil_rev_8_21_14_0_20_56_8]
MSKMLKIIFLMLGVGLFGWSVKTVDMTTVFNLLTKLGAGFLLILLFYWLVTLLDTLSWKYNFYPVEARHLLTWQLWRIRQIGEAYNTITPLGTLGGEPVKAQLLKDRHGLSLREGLASLVVARTTFLTALCLFFVPGIVLILQSGSVSPQFKTTSVVGMAIFSTLIFLFFLFQITGTLGRLAGWVARWGVGGGVVSFLSKLEALSRLMSGYYREHASRLILSIGYAFIGWIAGLGELYVTLVFLGFQPTLADLWIMESLAQLVRVGSFFIPLSLGAQEGGLILIFSAMGWPPDLGLTVSFVRRIKEMIWVGLGLAMGWNLAFDAGKVEVESPESP